MCIGPRSPSAPIHLTQSLKDVALLELPDEEPSRQHYPQPSKSEEGGENRAEQEAGNETSQSD